MRKLIRTSTLLLIVMLSIAGTRIQSAMAQDDTDDSGTVFDDYSQLEGLEEAVSRFYALDYETLLAEASPEGWESIEYPEGIQYVFAIIFKFDNDDHAKDALDRYGEDIVTELGGELEFTDIDVDDFNDDTIALGSFTEDEALGSTSTIVIISQEDEYVYLTYGIASGDNDAAIDAVSGVAMHVIDGDTGGDVTFNELGTSEGGLWDKFPDVDDDLVEGLVASDEQIFPVPAE